MAKLKEFILSNCADKKGTAQIVKDIGEALTSSNLEALAQRYAVRMILEALIRRDLYRSGLYGGSQRVLWRYKINITYSHPLKFFLLL